LKTVATMLPRNIAVRSVAGLTAGDCSSGEYCRPLFFEAAFFRACSMSLSKKKKIEKSGKRWEIVSEVCKKSPSRVKDTTTCTTACFWVAIFCVLVFLHVNVVSLLLCQCRWKRGRGGRKKKILSPPRPQPGHCGCQNKTKKEERPFWTEYDYFRSRPL